MKDSLVKYIEYLDSDDDFTIKVRLTYVWNDAEYEHFMKLLMKVIDDYRGEQLFPLSVVYFFTSGIDRLVGMVSNPLFTQNESDEYKTMLNQRITELGTLKRKFCTGELLS